MKGRNVESYLASATNAIEGARHAFRTGRPDRAHELLDDAIADCQLAQDNLPETTMEGHFETVYTKTLPLPEPKGDA